MKKIKKQKIYRTKYRRIQQNIQLFKELFIGINMSWTALSNFRIHSKNQTSQTSAFFEKHGFEKWWKNMKGAEMAANRGALAEKIGLWQPYWQTMFIHTILKQIHKTQEKRGKIRIRSMASADKTNPKKRSAETVCLSLVCFFLFSCFFSRRLHQKKQKALNVC